MRLEAIVENNYLKKKKKNTLKLQSRTKLLLGNHKHDIDNDENKNENEKLIYKWLSFALLLMVVTMKLLLVLGFICLLFINGDCYRQSNDKIIKRLKHGTVEIGIKNNKVTIFVRKIGGNIIENVLSTKISNSLNKAVVELKNDCEQFTICVVHNNITHTKIYANPDGDVVKINRMVNNENGQLIDCFKLGDETQWFGGPQMRYQHWPIQHMYYDEEPYVPTHPTNMALTERYWLSSQGIYIYVDETAPLFLDQNNYKDKHLCLIAKNKAPYRIRTNVSMNWEIGVFVNARSAHEHAIKTHFGKPSGRPDPRMVVHPIWSTWARYKMNVSEKAVINFADEILKNGFGNSQLEIDDNWETCYGSAKFNPIKFPNVTRLVNDLKRKGFRVTLWIHPFINKGCNDGEAYDFAFKNNYFIKNINGDVRTSWWQGNDAAAIDFTNPKAVAWWVGRLKKLKALGIDSFKFDAGEESFVPQVANLTGPVESQPGIYTKNYTTNLAKHFDGMIEARVGWRTQQLPIFVRMIDKDTKWTWNNGLPTLITTLLQMNLNGYVFVLPDMIGGNGYVNNSFNDTELPSKELFIRWMQANVFMPSMQYSFVPWDFDSETVAISKKFTELHAKIAPKINELMNKSVQTGAPLNPPIWWVDPENINAHKINDEYLLGEEILVAPVIEENANVRDVYLPKGKWKDGNTEKLYTGPMLIKDYSAPLNILPYFYKI